MFSLIPFRPFYAVLLFLVRYSPYFFSFSTMNTVIQVIISLVFTTQRSSRFHLFLTFFPDISSSFSVASLSLFPDIIPSLFIFDSLCLVSLSFIFVTLYLLSYVLLTSLSLSLSPSSSCTHNLYSRLLSLLTLLTFMFTAALTCPSRRHLLLLPHLSLSSAFIFPYLPHPLLLSVLITFSLPHTPLISFINLLSYTHPSSLLPSFLHIYTFCVQLTEGLHLAASVQYVHHTCLLGLTTHVVPPN